MSKRSCICLFSGGLDSLLALRLIVLQGVEVIAFHASSVFHDGGDPDYLEGLRRQCLELGARDVLFQDTTETMVAFTKKPRFGYGKHVNACVDCRLMTIACGKAAMDAVGADFVISGEVTGQRPMSQRKEALAFVTRKVNEMELEGLLVRPLCAKLLEPTLPETKGWINREKLYGFHGRTRKPQIALAEELGITTYPSPAGGCLLTDPGFAYRLKELMAQEPDWNGDDARLLRVGRHYRISPETKVVVARTGEEGETLRTLARPGEHFYLTQEKPGALALVHGPCTPEAEQIAAGLAGYYSKFRARGEAALWRWSHPEGDQNEDAGSFPVLDPATLQEHYIGIPQG